MGWVRKLDANSGWGDVHTIEVARLERQVAFWQPDRPRFFHSPTQAPPFRYFWRPINLASTRATSPGARITSIRL
jgi:hypothetical protein